jgi:hypothetical protein
LTNSTIPISSMAIEKELFNRKIEGEDNVLGIVSSMNTVFVVYILIRSFSNHFRST